VVISTIYVNDVARVRIFFSIFFCAPVSQTDFILHCIVSHAFTDANNVLLPISVELTEPIGLLFTSFYEVL